MSRNCRFDFLSVRRFRRFDFRSCAGLILRLAIVYASTKKVCIPCFVMLLYFGKEKTYFRLRYVRLFSNIRLLILKFDKYKRRKA